VGASQQRVARNTEQDRHRGQPRPEQSRGHHAQAGGNHHLLEAVSGHHVRQPGALELQAKVGIQAPGTAKQHASGEGCLWLRQVGVDTGKRCGANPSQPRRRLEPRWWFAADQAREQQRRWTASIAFGFEQTALQFDGFAGGKRCQLRRITDGAHAAAARRRAVNRRWIAASRGHTLGVDQHLHRSRTRTRWLDHHAAQPDGQAGKRLELAGCVGRRQRRS
jgi:hypothetical protein